MTKTLSLEGKSQTAGLELDKKSTEFLTSPYRKDFMTEFSIGSNKLSFYGQPFVMSFNSELIHASLPTLASSKPPHVLLNFGVVLEKPMTLLWLYLNGLGDQVWSGILTTAEMLHLYRLCNYFDVSTQNRTEKDEITFFNNIKAHIMADMIQEDKDKLDDLRNDIDKKTIEAVIRDFFETKDQEGLVHKMADFGVFSLSNLRQNMIYLDIGLSYLPRLESAILVKFVQEHNSDLNKNNPTYETAKNTLIGIINRFLAKVPAAEEYIPLLDYEDLKNAEEGKISKNVIITTGLARLEVPISNNPDVQFGIDYTFVLIDDGDVESYAEKKVLAGDPTMGKLNPEWKKTADNPAQFEKCKENTGCAKLEVESWGPHIWFNIIDMASGLINDDGYFIRPIFT